ncbi:hypothetical protein EPA93_44115 [Ktedonosporobacter rubrisoli]|uniref:Phosphodiester glycosidase domain-containing protein n=2 Tax=Ktedonosporobacter rubrisoli TaxID=2509675 RepID=A0A4P6K5X7_KTERU|nr:hypothetical protein EPA93_44115 [Ktedonosporobacter rubrisoli]
MPAAFPARQATPAVSVAVAPARAVKQRKKLLSRKKVLGCLLSLCCVTALAAIVFFSQTNGQGGAWLADTLRSIAGPTITAQIESWYLGLSNTAQQAQYQLGNKQVAAPWKTSQKPTVVATQLPEQHKQAPIEAMPMNTMQPVISPPIPGEGVWTPLSMAPAPYSYLPQDARAFIRPDPSHPYAIVTLLQFDMRFALLHIVAGTVEPGGPLGHHGTGVIPAADRQSGALLAALNGGFKYADGKYGLGVNGRTYVPAVPGAATIAVTKEGKLILGAWGKDPQLQDGNPDLVAWRQNAALLIDDGTINPLTQDGAAWGGTILNRAYTWRSGLGITASGSLIYAAGDGLTALTLGQALRAAGAVMAMQTDINPFWVRAFLYDYSSSGKVMVTKLNPAMQGTGYEYLNGTERDFFYLTRVSPKVPPTPSVPNYPRELPPS